MNEITGAARDFVANPAATLFLSYAVAVIVGALARPAVVAAWRKFYPQAREAIEAEIVRLEDKLAKAKAGNAAIDF